MLAKRRLALNDAGRLAALARNRPKRREDCLETFQVSRNRVCKFIREWGVGGGEIPDQTTYEFSSQMKAFAWPNVSDWLSFIDYNMKIVYPR